jgi:alginate O-acetyltransferase complex protein AlgJ
MASSTSAVQEPNPVHIGHDGWLFLVSGSNSVLDLFKTESSFTDAHAKKWVSLLTQRKSRLAKKGIEYFHMPAPEKITVLHKYFNGDVENISGSPITQLSDRYQSEIPCFINPLPYFAEQPEENPLFWKTDTHWSFWGSFAAYQLICDRLGIGKGVNFPDHPYQDVCRYCDLGMKLDEPVKETSRIFTVLQNAERVSCNKMVAFKEDNNLENAGNLHVGSSVVFRNEKAIDPRKVVLFGDSFSEYRPLSLTGMVAETFAEVHFVWSSRLDFDFIDSVNPDIVISELAERFMTRVPIDDLELEEFVEQRIHEHLVSTKQAEPKQKSVMGKLQTAAKGLNKLITKAA